MRVPYVINVNTKVAYEPSAESTNLIDERARKLFSEDLLQWDKDQCPVLPDFCVERIKENFSNNPLLNELPCRDRNYLLEILDTNLDLALVVPLIDAEIYWKRRYHDKFGTIVSPPPSWKTLFIERYIQELIEQAQPEYADEDNMGDITTLCSPYIRKLLLTQLQAWKPPLNWDEEDIPEFFPIEHINFDPIFQKLYNIEEFGVVYGMNNVSDAYNKNMFEFSVLDCQRLGKALNNHLKSLRILRIHRSKFNDDHCRAIMHCLIQNTTVEILDLSHCQIGDTGALCLAKVLCVHPKLTELNLCNNEIGIEGGEGIGYAILEEGCNLNKLDLRLNPLGHDGAMGIMRALVRSDKIKELSMAGCYFEEDTPLRVGQMLQLNSSLIKLDVSNNWFDDDGGDALIEGMTINRTVEWLDVRNTDISKEQQYRINKLLLRNRGGLDDVEESVEEEEEEDSKEHVEGEETTGEENKEEEGEEGQQKVEKAEGQETTEGQGKVEEKEKTE